MKEFLSSSRKYVFKNFKTLFMWIGLSVIVGVLTGLIGSCFSWAVGWANEFRPEHPWLVLLLPVGGLLIVFLYHICKEDNNTGTNLVLTSMRAETKMRPILSPLILITTFITHLLGGSAGREGAALQFGGSLGVGIGKIFKFPEEDMKLIVLAGMSGAFSAIFGAPLAAIVFTMELISVGIMHYAALVPNTFASFIAYFCAMKFGLVDYSKRSHAIANVPDFYSVASLKIILLALGCAGLGVLFCLLLHKTEHIYKKLLPNPYVRVFVGGVLVAFFASLLRTQDYLGTGELFINHCFSEPAAWYGFLLKIFFTCLTLCAGFKGGEIVPSMFIGAAMGSAVSVLLGLPVDLCAACGLIGVFCAVTNCPIASLIFAFELFGFAGIPFYAITIAISYMMSGYYSLYPGQKIMYSKTHAKFINRNSH